MTDDGTQGDDVLARLNPASKGRVRVLAQRPRPRAAARRRRARSAQRRDATSDSRRTQFVMLTASRLATLEAGRPRNRALPRVRTWAPHAQLVVVGDGEERARLEGAGAQPRRRRRGAFAGAVPQTEVMRYMHAADVFLAVADLSNVGNPLLEAMACGMCIVAVDAGDTRDLIIDDGVPGVSSIARNRSGVAKPLEDRLAELLVALAGDAAQRQRLAAGAAAYARRAFWTWDQRMAAEMRVARAQVSIRSRTGALELTIGGGTASCGHR